MTTKSVADFQASFNLISLWDHFDGALNNDDIDICCSLLELLSHSWDESLKFNFPDKKHLVSSSFEEGCEPEIWFNEIE